MRYAVISDIHSNLEALAAVMERIDAAGVESIVCLGDIVGYNAQPNECVAMLRARGALCVMGNHDSRAASIEEPDDFNPAARTAVLWTRSALAPSATEYLRGLPRTLRPEGRFMAVHGVIDDTDAYMLGLREVERNLRLLDASGLSLCFFGHTHVPAVYASASDGRDLDMPEPARVKLRQGVSYLINPGAVGQPRDGDPGASFLVYDSEKKLVTFERVCYDVERASAKVREAGLPMELAQRLFMGR